MKQKNEIDKLRESSGRTDIGTLEDGAIIESITIANRLLIIKERSIYEMLFADDIDPDRKNINLPKTIQKLVINKGTESETVARIFLTAKSLFKSEFLDSSVKCDIILSLAIDLLSEFTVLEKEICLYIEEEEKVSKDYEERRNKKSSYQLPTIVNIETRCKTVFQKVDHIEQLLMEIITNFYPNEGLTKQSHFPKFYDLLKSKYGIEDVLVDFIGKTLQFMRKVRELRNGLEHRLPFVVISNFELKIDGNIIVPTIELNYKDVKLEKTSLSEFLVIVNQNMIEITEVTFALLASKNQKMVGLRYQLKIIPVEQRRNKFVRFGFWSPIGNDGYYHQ